MGLFSRKPRAAEIALHRDIVRLHELMVKYERDQDAYGKDRLSLTEFGKRQKVLKAEMKELRARLGDDAWKASPQYKTWRESVAWLKANGLDQRL